MNLPLHQAVSAGFSGWELAISLILASSAAPPHPAQLPVTVTGSGHPARPPVAVTGSGHPARSPVAVTGGGHDVWISGTRTLLHWNGSSFEKFPSQGGRAKVSTAGGELFGVSSGAILSQFKQGAWQDLKPSTTCAIQTVVATGNDIYIGGSVAGKLMPGCIRKWTGSDWLDVLKPNYIVTDMIATSPSDIWSLSANYNGEVYHYNGLAWQLTDTGTRTRFERIFAR